MQNIKKIESEQTLEAIENAYKSGGINAVKNWLEENFSIGTDVNLNQGTLNEKVYKICNRTILQLDAYGSVLNFAYLPKIADEKGCNLIRVFALSYITEPFQIELYGNIIEEEK